MRKNMCAYEFEEQQNETHSLLFQELKAWVEGFYGLNDIGSHPVGQSSPGYVAGLLERDGYEAMTYNEGTENE